MDDIYDRLIKVVCIVDLIGDDHPRTCKYVYPTQIPTDSLCQDVWVQSGNMSRGIKLDTHQVDQSLDVLGQTYMFFNMGVTAIPQPNVEFVVSKSNDPCVTMIRNDLRMTCE